MYSNKALLKASILFVSLSNINSILLSNPFNNKIHPY